MRLVSASVINFLMELNYIWLLHGLNYNVYAKMHVTMNNAPAEE